MSGGNLLSFLASSVVVFDDISVVLVDEFTFQTPSPAACWSLVQLSGGEGGATPWTAQQCIVGPLYSSNSPY